MSDKFQIHRSMLTSPASEGFNITPSDDDDLAFVSRMIYIGGAGNVSVVLSSGSEITLNGVISGTVLPLRVKKVNATGTTATNLVALL